MLALRIALRYLLAKKSHTAVNVISLISVAGIAVAAMAMVCVLSVFNGFSDLAYDRVSLVDPDIKITPRQGKVICNADSLAEVISRIDGVDRVAVTIEDQGLALYNGAQSPVVMRGVPDGYENISAIGSLVIDGEMLDGEDAFGRGYASLSVGTAIKIGARPDPERNILITVPRRIGRINPAFTMAAFRTDTLVVSAVYQTNQSEFDNDMVYLPLEVVRDLLDYETEGSAVEVAVKEDCSIDKVVKGLSDALGETYMVADRLRQQEESFKMIAIEKWITFLMLVFVLIMASFNILSTMSMLIIEKEDNLKILRSLGSGDGLLRRIFLNEGILIAVAGGAAGIIVGVVLCVMQQAFGLIELGGDHSQMSIVAYPCRLMWTDVLLVSAVVAVIGFISGYISSRSLPSEQEN